MSHYNLPRFTHHARIHASTNHQQIYSVFLDDSKKRPFFTALIFTLVWASFLYGLFFIIGVNNADISPLTPISPPNEVLWFVYIDAWPGCIDHRKEVWRLFSLQFVHAGFIHIISNVLVGLPYGILFEKMYGFFPTLCVYQIGEI